MSKVFKKLKGGFTQVPNCIFDHKLSPKAAGIYAFIMSRADGWEFSLTGTAVVFDVGIDIIRAGVNELENKGFLLRSAQHKLESGKFSGGDWSIFDEPQIITTALDFPMPSTALDFPIPEKPIPENPMQYNTIPNNTELNNTNDSSNQTSKAIVSAADRPVTANAAAKTLFDLEKEYDKVDQKSKQGVYEFIKANCPCFIHPYVDYWNLFAEPHNIPQVLAVNDTRKKKFACRIKEKEFNFLKILYKANQGDFITKAVAKWFTFDWIIANETNYLKVIEGNYENREKPTTHANQSDKQRIDREKAEQRTAELINQR